MKKYFLLIYFLLLILLIEFVSAVPANPTPFTLEQPDGSKFEAVQVGDERNAWIEIEDGYTITQDLNGEWFYASEEIRSEKEIEQIRDSKNFKGLSGTHILKPTSLIVGKNAPLGLKKHIRPKIKENKFEEEKVLVKKNIEEKSSPSYQSGLFEGPPSPPSYSPGSIGTEYVVVILINFTNKEFAADKNQIYYWNLLFNESNPDSMNSYYKEVSYGKLNVTGIVTQIVNSSKTMEYYGTDGPPDNCFHTNYYYTDTKNGCKYELAREAVKLANPNIDFSQYDKDSDGKVDHLIIIHAGNDQASSGVGDDIWSHQWYIYPSPGESVDGKYAYKYIMLAETDPVGVYAHEFGHDLGLPDLYNTATGGYVVAYWDLMDVGSWGGSPQGTKPVHISAWGKIQLGWLTPTIVNGILSTNINQIETNAEAYRLEDIWLNLSKEYFLVENRQKTGFDTGLPSGYNTGLVIWHIDNKQGDNNGATKMVYPELAGGSLDTAPFASNYGYTTFNSSSNPNTNRNDGTQTTIFVKDIGNSGSSMPATLFGGIARLQSYLITTAKDVTQNQTFNFSVGVRCVGGDCGNVSALLDPAAITCDSSPCVAGSNLIKCSGSSEPNQPPRNYNTIDGCSDGLGITCYGEYESVENITVTDLDRNTFVGDDNIEVKATVFCWDTGSSDSVNFIYTNDSTNPKWVVKYNIDPCPGSGFQTITKNFRLDNVAGTHTIRVLIVYANDKPLLTCGATEDSSYSDTDDVSIQVSPGKGIIPVNNTSAKPFYTTSPQPQNESTISCLSNMKANDECNLTWQVNATGVLGLYKFFAIFNSNLPLAQVESDKVNITIVSQPPESISITVSGYPINFGNLNPGTNNNSAEGSYTVHIDSSTNVNVDLYHQGTNFLKDSNNIPITNMKWHNSTNVNNAYIMQNGYGTNNISNIAPNTDVNMYYWLSIPGGQPAAQNYQSQITIKAVKTGTSPESGGGGGSSMPAQTSTTQTTKTTQGGASVNIIKLN